MFWEVKEYWYENKQRLIRFLPFLIGAFVFLIIAFAIAPKALATLGLLFILILIGAISAIVYVFFGPIFELITFVTVIAGYIAGFWGAAFTGIASILLSRHLHGETDVKVVPYLIAIVITAGFVASFASQDIRTVGILAFLLNNALIFILYALSGTPTWWIGPAVIVNAIFNIMLFVRLAPFLAHIGP